MKGHLLVNCDDPGSVDVVVVDDPEADGSQRRFVRVALAFSREESTDAVEHDVVVVLLVIVILIFVVFFLVLNQQQSVKALINGQT